MLSIAQLPSSKAMPQGKVSIKNSKSLNQKPSKTIPSPPRNKTTPPHEKRTCTNPPSLPPKPTHHPGPEKKPHPTGHGHPTPNPTIRPNLPQHRPLPRRPLRRSNRRAQ